LALIAAIKATGLDVSSTQDLVFAPGPLATILITDPGDVLAKNRVGYTITRKDSYGNMATGSSDTVYLFSTSTSSTSAFYNDAEEGSRITSITLPEGEASASFWYYDEEPGTYTISVSDNGSSPDGTTGVVDGADTLTVIPVAVRFGIFPRGISVGTVSKTTKKPYGISQEVEVLPAVDFSKLEEILVALSFNIAPSHLQALEKLPLPERAP
jgi:hypothetical protein